MWGSGFTLNELLPQKEKTHQINMSNSSTVETYGTKLSIEFTSVFQDKIIFIYLKS